MNYIGSWFIIDFVSVIPFDVIFKTGPATKLVRVFRMPRLIKLIDISRFSKLLKQFQTDQSNDKTIMY